MTESVLAEAERVIYGDREKTYGDPGKNCRAIAAVWSQILGVPVSDEQVCLCMVGVKLARLANDPTHRDSLVDVCGYAALLERIQRQKAGGDGCGSKKLTGRRNGESSPASSPPPPSSAASTPGGSGSS